MEMDAALEQLVLDRLGGALWRLLADGLQQPILGGLFQGGPRTPWTLLETWTAAIEQRCESTLAEKERDKPSACLIGLVKAVDRINQLYEHKKTTYPPMPELKFRALVCYSLKCGSRWLGHLARTA